MSNFDAFRFSFRDKPAEQKLQILRAESLRELTVIQGYAELLRHAFEQSETNGELDEGRDWVSKIVESAKTVRELIDAVTSFQNQNEHGLSELQAYESLVDAIREKAQRLALPLAEAIDDGSKIFIHSHYPLVLADEPKRHRQIHFALTKSGYSVELLSLSESHMFRVEYQVFSLTLDDVAIVINQWLLEQIALSEIQKRYPPNENGG
jgi:hypothetical protein